MVCTHAYSDLLSMYHGRISGPTLDYIYKGLPKLSDKLRVRRMKLAGHLVRHPELRKQHTKLSCGSRSMEIPREEPLR